MSFFFLILIIFILDCRQAPIHAGRIKSQKNLRSESQFAINKTSFIISIIIISQIILPRIRKQRMRSSVMIKLVTSAFRSSKTGNAVDDDD